MKQLLSALLLFLLLFSLHAQELSNVCTQFNPYPSHLFSSDMNALPKVSIEIKDNRKLKGYVLLTTKKSGDNPYNSSIQLFDLQNPSIPVWFASLNENANNFLGDCKRLPNGNISFYLKTDSLNFPLPTELGEGAQGIVDGYFELNNQLEPIDFFTAASINNHDYKKFANGERLFLSDDGKELDLSAYNFLGKQLSKKTTVGCESIIILNKENKVSFYWKPLDHLDFSELDIATYEKIIDHNEDLSVIQFSRTNSVNIDPIDGNILASFRRSDMCVKIDRATGKILWRLGGNKSDFYLNDTSRFYLQHDFTRIANGPYRGLYSVFNNGNEKHPTCEGLIYELDEVTKKARLVQRLKNEMPVKSNGQGNFEVYADGTALMNNGNANATEKRANFITLFSKDTLVANISLPKNVIVYRAVWLKDFSLVQPSMSLEKTNDKWNPTAKNGAANITWSEHDTAYNSTSDKTPIVFYKKPFGFGYVTSAPTFTTPGTKKSDILFPETKAKRSVITATEKCALTFNLNGLAYNFRKTYIDLEHILMITKP